jgi:hypothetical protein
MSDMFYSAGSPLGSTSSPFNQAGPLYPSPFADYASTAMPSQMSEILDLCRYVFHANSAVREASRRLLAYFITSITVSPLKDKSVGMSPEEKQKIEDYCDVVLNYRTLSEEIGLDYMGEGNSFVSVIEPFQRFLYCSSCVEKKRYFGVPIKEFRLDKKYEFRWQPPNFHGLCPICGYRGRWERSEVAIRDAERIFVKRWPANEMKIRATPNSRRKSYIWEIPGDYRQSVRRGDPLVLEDEPWEFIQAALNNTNFEFDEDALFHLAEPTMASVKTGGWGLPRTFVNFRHVWYYHMLHRMVEAVGADFLLPVRTVTPAVSKGDPEDDPAMQIDMYGLRHEVEYALRQRRVDPAQWLFLSSPIEANMLGGDASRLVPPELLDQGLANLLNAYGYPIEFWKGSVQTQTAIPAVRMMQAANAPLIYKISEALTWILGKIAKIVGWEPVRITFKPPTLVDDIQMAMARLQMVGQGLVSESEGVGGIGLDYADQLRKKVDDELLKMKEQRRLEEAGVAQEVAKSLLQPPQQQQAQGGGAQGGDPAQQQVDPSTGMPMGQGGGATGAPGIAGGMMGLPSGPAPGQKISLEQLQADGEAISQQLAMQPPGVRQGYMQRLKQRSPALHAQVKASLGNLDYQLKSQGGAMLRQQMYGQAS